MCFMRLGLHYGVPHYTVTIRWTPVADAGCVCVTGVITPPPLGIWMTSHGQCPRGGACECPRVGVFFNLSEGG